MAQVEADAGHDAFLERIFVDRDALLAKVPGRIDMGAAVIGHRDEHRRQSPDIAGVGQRVGVVLPHAVHDRGMSGIAGRAVIELAAEIDDFHEEGLIEGESAR